MIRFVRADRSSFKTVKFEPGMNVIVATRTKQSSDKDSTNGSGKSTIVDIIHFCLGGSIKAGRGLGKKELYDWTFTVDMELCGGLVSVSRNTRDPKRIFVDGDLSGWPIRPKKDKATGRLAYTVPQWTNLLGLLMFGLDESDLKYSPSFRSLISYFVRRGGENGGFLSPFTHFARQTEWDKQVNTSYLLGLEWEHASKWQVLKDREKVLGQIRQEAAAGILTNLVGSIGALEAERIVLEKREQEQTEQLESFRVHPQYQQIEAEANDLTKEIHRATNELVTSRRFLDSYEDVAHREKEPSTQEIEALYREAGIVLPDTVTKRFDEVLAFHRQVIENRHEFLRLERDRLKRRIDDLEGRIKTLSDERAEKLAILQAHGALEEHSKLEQRRAVTAAKLRDVSIRLENLKKFEQGKSALRIERELLLQQARMNLEERRGQRLEAIQYFNGNSESLYDAPGRLTVDVGPNGFVFDVEIKRSGSQGIDQMKVFCYDLMLAQVWSGKSLSPGFLVHDSTLFADVDSRQVAKALQLAARESERLGFQYICMLNVDTIPSEHFSGDFELMDFCRLELTDATDDGGVLGFRF